MAKQKLSKAQQRFKAKQQYNQIVAQLNQRAAEANASPKGTAPATVSPSAAPQGPMQWWQYQQQYGSPTTPVSNRPFGNIATGAGGIQAPQYPPDYLAAQAEVAAQQYNQTAQNPELKYNRPAWMSANMPASAQAPQGPMQWWQYAKAFGPIKQAPEAPLDDFYFRHPDTPFTPSTSGGGGYGYGGGGYRRRRGGGGGRGRYPYEPRPSYEGGAPAWARGGLANWTIG